MWPCFQEGDLLEIEDITDEQIRIGDCLLFPDDSGQLVVHRLIDMRSGLRTRGDASTTPDPHKITPDQVRGRVAYRYRLECRNKVTGGRLGLIAATLYCYVGRIDPYRQSCGGRIARSIRSLSSVILRPIWRLGKVRRLQSPEQSQMLFWVFGKGPIGRLNPASGEWQLLWPWRIFIDPVKLMGRDKNRD